MDTSEAVYKGIKNAGIDFIVSLPCVNLSKLLIMVEDDEDIIHVPVTREEEGIGICAGAYLAGKKIAILMQNSGLGNCVNGLTSLFELYKIPLVMIMSHRGTDGESIVGQVPMGEATPKILDSLNIEHFKPNNDKEAIDIVSKSWDVSSKNEMPIGILLEIKYWTSC
ncbi:sulfopyruvate decarboxylase subunit alpha [Methanobrevibacter sp. OttesenSCG-928-K11]|nr:sulfopyruvate decarboxylase subunit alpha [Methanobrevibacter sp. OttesenSCG-928-K11]MDL2270928.1 sulfopyruvate decarboxylase subunit alpha [Methanobrevibacter sp. OttesenSCG-928-I08]